MERIEPTRALAVKVWWAFLWRAALGTVVGSFLLGGFLGLVFVQLLGVSGKAVESIALLAGLAVGFAVSIEAMYRVLKKRFRDFEIALIRQ